MDQVLTKLGLSENEAKVYLALLSLGECDASGIAKQAQVKRPTTYLALGHLVELGLISEIPNLKEKKFKAEDPERLTRLTRKMRRQVISAELKLDETLPSLQAIKKKVLSSPRVTFYQGLEGVKSIIEEATEHPETWYYFGQTEEWVKVLSEQGLNEFAEETRVLRRKAGRPTCYIITDENYYKIKLFQKHEPEIRRAKILPEMNKTKSGLVIYGKKIAIIGVSGVPFGAVIESAETTELVKMMFMMIWQSLPEEKAK